MLMIEAGDSVLPNAGSRRRPFSSHTVTFS
jgi:hypothetical protein